MMWCHMVSCDPPPSLVLQLCHRVVLTLLPCPQVIPLSSSQLGQLVPEGYKQPVQEERVIELGSDIYKVSQPRGWASGSCAYGRHEMQGVKCTRHECSVIVNLRPLLLLIRSRHQFSSLEKNSSHCGIQTHVHLFTRQNT